MDHRNRDNRDPKVGRSKTLVFHRSKHRNCRGIVTFVGQSTVGRSCAVGRSAVALETTQVAFAELVGLRRKRQGCCSPIGTKED